MALNPNQYETKDSNVFACGWNHYGQCGLGEKLEGWLSSDNASITSAFPVDELNGVEVYFASAGAHHSAVISDRGHVYTCGQGQYGQLGHGDTENFFVPRLVRLLRQKTVSFVSCGAAHTLALTNTGEAFSWGSNQYGQLGIGAAPEGKGDTVVLYPRRVRFSDRDKSENMLRIAAGAFHCIAINENGYMYSWGRNDHYQLGTGNKSPQTAPRLLHHVTDVCFIECSAGVEHSAAVSEVGELYTWGRGAYGQLGHGNTNRKLVPVRNRFFVDSVLKVTQVECGGMHTLVLTQRGDLFSFGLNDFGQLGHGFGLKETNAVNTNCLMVPKQVRRLLTDDKATTGRGEVVKISAGLLHSLALTKDGTVFSWGAGSSGRLGLGDLAERGIPTKIQSLEGREINDVAAGWYHSISISAVELDPKFAEPLSGMASNTDTMSKKKDDGDDMGSEDEDF